MACPGRLWILSISLEHATRPTVSVGTWTVVSSGSEVVDSTMSSKPQFKKIESILSVALSGETGAQLHFSKGLRMKKEKDKLLFSYPQGVVNRRGNL